MASFWVLRAHIPVAVDAAVAALALDVAFTDAAAGNKPRLLIRPLLALSVVLRADRVALTSCKGTFVSDGRFV